MNKQKRMENIIARFQEYVATYTNNPNYKDYSDPIFINDMIYGIGIAIDNKTFRLAPGYAKWKNRIIALLGSTHEEPKDAQDGKEQNMSEWQKCPVRTRGKGRT